MKKKILLLLITVFAYSFVGYTQQPYIYIPFDPKPQVQLPASDAQSLGQFGEIPVDLFTGRVNINIPIYTIRYNGMEVPISISYHGGGIKVTDEAGSVGLGWTLNVGGVINRIVRGMPDELFDSSNRVFGHSRLHEPNAQMQNTLGDFRGFIRRIQANSTKYPARNPSVLSSPYTPAELDLALLISQYGPLFDGGHFDTAPDNYIFNVMGLSGAFVYPAGPNSNVKNDDSRILQSNNGVTIHRNNTAGFYSIQDANGFNHLFLDKDAEYQTFFYRVDNINDIRPFDEREHDISFRYRSSWWLSRIVSPANEVITFHYSDVRIVYPAQQFHGFVYSRTRGFGMCQLTDNPLQFPINNTRHTNSRDTVFKKLLSHIETPTSIVRFNYHIPAGHYLNHSPQLESIVVFSRADSINPVEKTTFNYLRRGNARAQLRTLTRHGSNGETQSHRFSYHPGLGELSRLNDERRDHWGFFAPTSRGRFPVLKTLGHPAPPALWNNVNYTNRNADISTAAAGMLAGIVYPTGGSTTLVWEPHTWSRMSRAGDRAQWDRDLGNREIPASNNQSHSLVLRGAKGHEQLHTVPFTTTRPSTIILDFSGYYPPDEIAKLENNPGVPSPGFCLSGWDCNLTAPAVVIYMNNVEIDRIYICRETIQQGLREINMPQSGNLRFRLENPRGGFSALHDQHCKALYERFNMFEHGTPPFGNISIQIHWSEGSSLVPNPTWAVGGVRIQSITNNSGSGALIRRFEYAPDNASHCYGVLAFPVRYGTIIERCHTIIVPGNQDCNNMSGARITDCPQTLILRSHGLPFVLNGGSHIEYSQVTETIFSELRGADRRPIRRTIYHFHTGADLHRSDIDDTGYGIMVSADMMQLTSRSHWRGLRKKVEYADERRETTFNYQVLELNNGNIPMITGTLFTIGDYTGLLDGNQSFSPYKDMGIVQYRVIPYNRRVGSIVVDGERTKSTQSFAYASNVFSDSRTVNLPIRQTTVDSNGEEITRHINYWQNTGRIYSSFTVRNGRVIEAHRNLYDHSLRIVERLTALLDPANLPLADGFDPSTQINDLVESYTYRNNRLVQVRNHHTGISTVFLWSYRGSYPVAEIQNATFEQVQNALGGISAINTLHDTFVPDMDSLNELRTKLPNSKVTTMTYQPLVGIRSITDPRGITTFFTYNGFGQLQEKYIIENGQRKIIHRMEYNWSVQ